MIDENKIKIVKNMEHTSSHEYDPCSVCELFNESEVIDTLETLWRIARAAQVYIKLPEGEDDKAIIALDKTLSALPSEEKR